MTSIDSHDAQTDFSELLRRVEQGEEITITCSGVPVGKLVPFVSAPNRGVHEPMEAARDSHE